MGEAIPGSEEELLKEQGNTKPDPDSKKGVTLADIEAKIRNSGDAPG